MPQQSPAERFAAQKMASRGNCYVYVLLLEGQRFAVGHTECLSRRLHDHWTGEGTAWTKKYKPCAVLEILRTTIDSALGLEEAKCMEYKLNYGFNRARGGVDNNPADHAPPGWWKGECPFVTEAPETDTTG